MEDLAESEQRQTEANKRNGALTSLVGMIAMIGGDYMPSSPESIRTLGNAIVAGGIILTLKGVWDVTKAAWSEGDLPIDQPED